METNAWGRGISAVRVDEVYGCRNSLAIGSGWDPRLRV